MDAYLFLADMGGRDKSNKQADAEKSCQCLHLSGSEKKDVATTKEMRSCNTDDNLSEIYGVKLPDG